MLLHKISPVDYVDPWNKGYAQRMHMLTKSKTRVAYFYEEANNSTFRYRAYNMVQVLNGAPEYGVSGGYFFLTDALHFDEIAKTADVLVICRSRYCARLAALVMKFRARGKRVLFDVDDLVFDTDYAHLIMDTLGVNLSQEQVLNDWFAMISRMGQTLRLCDGAITTNAYLAGKIKEFSGLPVHVVPNFMNQEQLAVSSAVFEAKQHQAFQSQGRKCFGYFSGSPSHQHDFAIVEHALATVLAERDDVEVAVVGYIEKGVLLSSFSERIKYFPFQDYVNLQRLVGQVEFNLMPLQSNSFTDCKSELKYFEAAAVGTLSIASPSFTYSRAIQHDATGYLSKAHEWVDMMMHALDRSVDYASMADAARADALNKFGWQVQVPTILQALGFSEDS
ncbi:glycosyltransferase [Variovorax dokdonensis]|uniref:Glycosyltransferase n=1 Tax=Variovorax dokdonensis TaxID=344883 RepID=A0ABT7NB62_9BURK|nr:glycosyltransferase [Variovorax dokdonensis]MDM0045157.1 glycosyltransferase [Variovorax dokdonensis]